MARVDGKEARLSLCSVIVPVFNMAALTQQCLETLLAQPPQLVEQEIVVADDGSTDGTAELLASFGDRIRVLRSEQNRGFAHACNRAAQAARGSYLLFLNNDTVPQPGWLDALVEYANAHPEAAVVGSKLLFPNGTVQHAGVVVCTDGKIRHLYTGFPADHPAVNKSRAVGIVTAACALMRRDAFERAGGFDMAFRNGFEDVDLCLRLGDLGYEVHYCHNSELVHLESMSEGRYGDMDENEKLLHARWGDRLRPNDVDRWLEDGLLELEYSSSYPVAVSLSPLLGTLNAKERERRTERVLAKRARQMFKLLRQNSLLEFRTKTLESALEQARAEHAGRVAERNALVSQLQAELQALSRQAREDAISLRAELASERREQAEIRNDNQKIREALAAAARVDGERDRQIAEISKQVAQLSATVGAALEDIEEVVLDPHRADDGKQLEYGLVLRRVRRYVRTMLPAGSTVAVISKGDPDLLAAPPEATMWHFPRAENGLYAGYYPACSTTAIAHLEALRAEGAEYLLIPESSRWWLDHYKGFARHLERHYGKLVDNPGSCVLFALQDASVVPTLAWCGYLEEAIIEFQRRYDRDPAILDWNTGLRIAQLYEQQNVFSPRAEHAAGPLPYLDASVDIVAIPAGEEQVAAEAARVAEAAVVTFEQPFPANGSCEVSVDWKIAQPGVSPPPITILIPSYNGIEHTERCVIRLGETLPRDYDVEVLVVDDCSTDDTQQRLARLADTEPRLRVLRNEENLGFLATNNRGVEEARGEMIVLLNNDTLPMPNWLPPLLRVFDHYPDAGAVVGKLIYPDGTLQEAGGIIFADGRAANYGKWEVDADHPLFNYVREVDYGSAALLATKRSLWLELGGFDTRYRPIYCEDSDYCFKVRERGLRVYYQPETVVIHLEGATSGTDESSGDKRYQVRNREQLAEKWQDALRRQPPYPSHFGYETLHALAVRDEGGW
jgi:GT2 family glycosyltransferase